jgi:hypothetical protein
MVGVDFYRDPSNASSCDQELAALLFHGKPLVITEFGVLHVSRRRGQGRQGLEGQRGADLASDEAGQVAYLRGLVEIYERNGVDTACRYTFASWNRQ